MKGRVTKIRMDADDGYTVCDIQTADQESITCIGHFPCPNKGEWVRVEGEWEEHQRYGEQLRVEQVLSTTPPDLYGKRAYLSNFVDGIGWKLAGRILDELGEEAIEKIDGDHTVLRDIDGIGRERTEKAMASWEGDRIQWSTLSWLQQIGLTAKKSQQVWERWEEGTRDEIQENPYQLVDIHGISFHLADQVASRLGIDKNSDDRLLAGALYTLKQKCEKRGHVCAPKLLLEEKTADLLEVSDFSVDPFLGCGLSEYQGDIYRAAVERWEENTATHLKRIRGFQSSGTVHVSDSFLDPYQQRAVEAVWESSVVVITGGPGSGKTTLVKKICDLADQKRLDVGLCAPTGRAAKRLEQACGQNAQTIHRFLGYMGNGVFQMNRDNSLEYDLILVDEMSMVSLFLMSRLVDAIPSDATLVMIGDDDQLPSVEAGNVLADVIDSGAAKVVELQGNHRSGDLIVENARRIRDGNTPRYPGSEDFWWVDAHQDEAIAGIVQSVILNEIPRAGYDSKRDIQIISPMKQTEHIGCQDLNKRMQSCFAEDEGTSIAGRMWYLGDPVMQTRNDYDHMFFNGEKGEIIKFEEGYTHINLGDRVIQYPNEHFQRIALAYAVTVHKSQGSEYPVVVIPMSTSHHFMWHRNLLYTAITRAEDMVALVGEKRAQEIAISDHSDMQRWTHLDDRLRHSAGR